MGKQYSMITYRGNLTPMLTGVLHGWDETFRPYEIIDAEFVDGECAECERDYPHTHVQLQYATAETLKAQGASYRAAMQRRGLLP